MEDLAGVKQRFAAVRHLLDERSRRLVVAAESVCMGRGGISAVSRATGVSRGVIRKGIKELKPPPQAAPGRVRRPGGGRKRIAERDPSVVSALEKLLEPAARGGPESPLRWTCKSVRKLAEELGKQGHSISYPVVAELLHELGYSLQAHQKTREGGSHLDRNAQFEHINWMANRYLADKQPVIALGMKRKELVGVCTNGGQQLLPEGHPQQMRVHDFVIPALGRANPDGIYDLAHNTGWVSAGVDDDTAAFAVESIRRWWQSMGQPVHPKAKRLLVAAECGGGDGARVRLWKMELQKLAGETGLTIAVCHLPPGTSKWNRVEHRLFSFITQNWRGKPLVSFNVVVSLIAAATTADGLKVHAALDANASPPVLKFADENLAQVHLRRGDFHAEWNYEIRPASLQW
ncbi:MAG: ISAzo13 family transposase [Bryobacteraceae bacterium]|nr:ISAzo13 family transposase [Bryobacteraceae bacterium]